MLVIVMDKVKFLIEDDKDVISEFLKNLSKKENEKVKRVIKLLNDLGFARLINTEMCGGIQGQDNLWYLRAKYRTNIFRIFFFKHYIDYTEVYILLHGFIKKTNRIPKSEINLALKRKTNLLKELKN